MPILIYSHDNTKIRSIVNRDGAAVSCGVEQLISMAKSRGGGAQFWFYRTQAGAEVDLIVENAQQRTGYEFKCARSVTRRDASGLISALEDGVITSGKVVYAGDRVYPLYENIDAVPAFDVLATHVEQ